MSHCTQRDVPRSVYILTSRTDMLPGRKVDVEMSLSHLRD